MSTPRSIARSYRMTAHYAAMTARDGYGAPTYGAPVAILCRVERQMVDMPGGSGRGRDEATVVLTDQAIPTDALVWLPGEDTTSIDKGHVPMRVEVSPSLRLRSGDWTQYKVVL